MATQSLRNQIDRAKFELDVIKPKPSATVKVLCEPDPGLGGDSLQDFLLEVRDAKKTHDLVFVACFKWDDERVSQTIDGVRYFQTDFAAKGTMLSLLRSRKGNKHALEDVFMGLNGHVFGPGPWGILPNGTLQVDAPRSLTE